MMRKADHNNNHLRLRCDLALVEGLTNPFTPPTSRNVFAGVLTTTSAGDPASAAIRTAATPLELDDEGIGGVSTYFYGTRSFGLCVTMKSDEATRTRGKLVFVLRRFLI
jgi:hypothetical protein